MVHTTTSALATNFNIVLRFFNGDVLDGRLLLVLIAFGVPIFLAFLGFAVWTMNKDLRDVKGRKTTWGSSKMFNVSALLTAVPLFAFAGPVSFILQIMLVLGLLAFSIYFSSNRIDSIF